MNSGIDKRAYILLLDKLFNRIFINKASQGADKKMIERLQGKALEEQLFRDMEELISNIDRRWLSMLDTACPKLNSTNRKLAILLYFGFSTESIALLTGKKNFDTVYTAKTRLKNLISESGSPEAKKLLKTLGFEKKTKRCLPPH